MACAGPGPTTCSTLLVIPQRRRSETWPTVRRCSTLPPRPSAPLPVAGRAGHDRRPAPGWAEQPGDRRAGRAQPVDGEPGAGPQHRAWRPVRARHRPGTRSTRTTAEATPNGRARRHGRRHLGLATRADPGPGPLQPMVVAARTIGELSSQSTGIRPTLTAASRTPARPAAAGSPERCFKGALSSLKARPPPERATLLQRPRFFARDDLTL